MMPLNIQLFATSGYTDVTVASYIKLRFSWTAGTQNVANNYTPVSWKLQLISSNSSANINSSVAKDYSVTVDGKTWSGTNTVGLSGGATKTLASSSKNIYHNADGTKTFNYSFSQEFAITYSGSQIGTKSGSNSGTLNTIPRGSELGTISAFTIGNAINIPITKHSSSFTDTLEISVGGTLIKTVSSITNGYDVNFTAAELNNIYAKLPSATSGTFTFKLITKSGSTTIGTTTETAKGTIPSTVKPAISSVALSEYVSGIASTFGAYIQNKSRISGTVNATAGTGSSIETYKTTINGATYTNKTFTTGVLKTSGSNTYSVTVTDKRGRTATTSGTFTVLAYIEPTITKFTVVRSNADGSENVEGSYAKINATAAITSLSSKNTKSFILRYKIKGSTTWTTVENYTAGYTYTATNKLVENINVDNAYDFQLEVKDYFTGNSATTKSVSLSTAYTILDIKANGKGIAFGKVATEDGVMDVGFNKSYLPEMTYVGGDRENDTEKNIYFQTTAGAEHPSNCKIYGGAGTSEIGIGLFDVTNSRAILRYFTEENRLNIETETIRHNSYLIEALMTKTSGAATGRVHYENGLLLQWGTVSITPVANTPTKVNIKFPIAYATTPNIQVSMLSSVPGFSVTGVGHSDDSATDTDIYVTRTNTTATVVRWFTIGIKEV